jgi:cyclase
MKRASCLILLGLVALAAPQAAENEVAFEVLHVKGNVYLFASTLGNVTVQAGTDPGHDGVLLVDTGPAQLTERIRNEIGKISREPVRYILNTSADPDHNGGNEAFVKPGGRAFYLQPEIGIYAQDNVLKRMSAAGSGMPSAAWPTLTFDEGKQFEFNGEPIQIFAERSAHSDGDSIVFFRGSNVISAGDIFLTTGYPLIDLKRGGSIEGEIAALNHVLALSVPHSMQEGGTMVIPGHGRLCDQADVVDYRDMMTIIRDRVADLMARGKTLEQVKEARPSRDYDRRFSTPEWTGGMLVEAIYLSLKGDKQ